MYSKIMQLTKGDYSVKMHEKLLTAGLRPDTLEELTALFQTRIVSDVIVVH